MGAISAGIAESLEDNPILCDHGVQVLVGFPKISVYGLGPDEVLRVWGYYSQQLRYKWIFELENDIEAFTYPGFMWIRGVLEGIHSKDYSVLWSILGPHTL